MTTASVPAQYSLSTTLGIAPATVVELAEQAVDAAKASLRSGYDVVANATIDEVYHVPASDFDNA